VTNDEYCREIEAYLCRKNDGHLIRIVGPSFERVCDWASRRIPFKIVCQGIDRSFDRYYAKGPRRRPVHIDFCEADVLDAFEGWRRAVGVRLPGAGITQDTAVQRQRRSLPGHLTRVLENITSRLAAATSLSLRLRQTLEAIADEVSTFDDLPGPIRGDQRVRLNARLRELDRMMMDAVRNEADPALLGTLRLEAADQLAPFQDRLPRATYDLAVEAGVDRLLREREQLPIVTFD
jgi:hypothetical protein